jgi:L-lactate dehydrogenase
LHSYTKNESAVLNVSTLLSDYHGVDDVYLGVPCIVDRGGVKETLTLQISHNEKLLLHKSAHKLKELIRSIVM